MTLREWINAAEWLTSGEEGDYVTHEGRTAEVVNMCGGRYLLTENGEVIGLEHELVNALMFLDKSANRKG